VAFKNFPLPKKVFNGKVIAQACPKRLQANVAALYTYSQVFTAGLFCHLG
jgi:hypothetical protein